MRVPRAFSPFLLGLFLLTAFILPSPTSAQTPNLSISGVVWQDDNADGVRQPAEPGIAGAELMLAGAQKAKTDAAGRYSFGGLGPGQHSISFTSFNPSLWLQTQPSNPDGFARPPLPVNVMLSSQSVDNADLGVFAVGGLPRFNGSAWVNAQPANEATVRAYIGGVDCTLRDSFFPITDQARNAYTLRVAPASLIAGCGTEGARILFFINGQRTNETGEWRRVKVDQPPPSELPRGIPPPNAILPPTEIMPVSPPPQFAGQVLLNLTVGSAFAAYSGIVLELRDGQLPLIPPGAPTPVPSVPPILRDNVPVFLEPEQNVRIEALIDGKVCGVASNLNLPQSYIIVPSEALSPGCGRPGATVEFRVDAWPASGSMAWEPGIRGNLTLTYRRGSTTAPPATSGGTPIQAPSGILAAPPPSGVIIRPPDTGDGGLLP